MIGYVYKRQGDAHTVRTQYGVFTADSKEAAIKQADDFAHRQRIKERREAQRQALLRQTDRRMKYL